MKKKFSQKVASILDAPVVAVSREGYIELFSNSQAIIQGCVAILEYDNSIIKLQLNKNIASFKGEELFISSMNDSTAIICGMIVSIEFSTM